MEQVIYLTFSSLITTISYILQSLDYEKVQESGKALHTETLNICKIQSFLMVWFENSQYISATLIAFTVYRSVIYSEEIITGKTKIRRLVYLAIIFIFPFNFFAIAMLFFTVFGPSDFWCYFKLKDENSKENNLDNVIFYSLNYALFWILIGLNFYFNIKIISFIRKELSNENELISAKIYIRKLTIFPIIQTLLLIPGTINRFFELLLGQNVGILIIIHATAVCSTGLIYSVVYGLNNQIKELLINSFNKYFNRNQYSENINNNISNSQDDSGSNFNNSLHHIDNRVSFIGNERVSL